MPEFPSIPQDRFFRSAKVIRIVDGDTLDVQLDLGWSLDLKERLRLEFVNTPETRGDAERAAGRWVKGKVADLLQVDTPLIITSTSYDRTGRVRGNFGRTVALVYHAAEGWCLNQRLLDEKLAWPTDENGSLIGERSLAVLTGLPEELRMVGVG